MRSRKNFIEEQWQDKKVMTLKELVKLMDCSEITARRRSKKLKSITSCNKNGRYYTLASIAEFDEHGLWFYEDICFSENGTLIQTIVELVCTSASGLCGCELNKLLHMNTYSILARIMKESSLRREKSFGKFIYFSQNEEIYELQLRARKEMNEQHSLKVISDSVGVVALVEFIRHPELELKAISSRLNRQGVKVSESLLHSFFDYHGILKKTQDLRP